MDKDQILLDLMFFLENRMRDCETARSHFRSGSKNYEWHNSFVSRYKAAVDSVNEYRTCRFYFDQKYGCSKTGKHVNNDR